MTDEMMVVPEGHRVSVCRASQLPWINGLEGGAVLAQLGAGSDEADAELTAALERVAALVRAPHRRVLVAHGGSLAALMAPHDPAVTPVGTLIVWTVEADRLAHAPRAVALVERWLRAVQGFAASNDLAQAAYMLGANQTPFARGLAALLGGLGVEVRTPVPRDGGLLIEVVRPDGGVLTALAGASFEVAPVALAEGAALARLLAPGAPDARGVLRAPLLRKLTLDTVARGDAARPALYDELLRREVPLLLAIDTATGGPRGVSWQDGARATTVFGDEVCLYATAAGYGWAAETSSVAVVPARKLFEWAARDGVPLALFAEHGKDKRVYVLIEPHESKQLAQGKRPA